MIELSRHIESLMLKHDCVIVPGLGGFVTQYVPARRVEGEQLFLPPCHQIHPSREKRVFFPLHKGMDGFMSPEQYEKIYWKPLKKCMLALIDMGVRISAFSYKGVTHDRCDTCFYKIPMRTGRKALCLFIYIIITIHYIKK